MRWHILQTLLHKEFLRHATNRGGLALAGLLITASLLLAILNPAEDKGFSLFGGIHHCYIDFEEDNGLIQHLRDTVPDELRNAIFIRQMEPNSKPDQPLNYPTGTGAIQIRRLNTQSAGKPGYLIWLWHPNNDRQGMAVYESWFWRETYDYFQNQAAKQLSEAGLNGAKEMGQPPLDDNLWGLRKAYEELFDRYRTVSATLSPELQKPMPIVELKETPLTGSGMSSRASISTALVMFSLFFTCVYLMPSLTCEERERGLLLAQALSPANTLEILTAKFMFYPAFGVFLATILSGIHNPQVLKNPFYWLTMFTLALGSLGIGITLACVARTQRSASMAALCYMLVVALTLLMCQQNNIAYIPYMALEYHAPLIIHATLTSQIKPHHWVNLAACAALGFLWASLAFVLFRKRGWQ
ncbi:ABC transporter permease [Telmatocola sphagniphila]|uniref:ABC transporter permease n=1 Tax=Telmatocola sphagniphila TaxID=1123043 RepID=A0A8E6EWE4_9BACT|nr:ABC transporter permease [Telmatocola sphagniphila]QVL33712.1 ABC transporter permease [Telmatocola sphagniphila]